MHTKVCITWFKVHSCDRFWAFCFWAFWAFCWGSRK